MKKVVLGKSGLQVSPLVYGTLPLGPLQAGLTPAEGASLLRHALERGVNLLDTAALYETYPHVRAALEGYRGEVLIATKTHAPDRGLARRHVEEALRALGRERIEIVHLHGARLRAPFEERGEVFDELLRMRDEGKIAHLGLSSHYISAICEAAAHPEIDIIHPLVNRTGMGILDGGAEAMAAAIASASAAGKGVYAMKALAGGNLIADARESLRFVRRLAGVDAVAVGMLDEEEIEANIALFSDESGHDDRWERLQSRRRHLKIMERFCKGCGHCVPACASGALELADGRVRLDEESCILCGYCAASCPEFIIRVV